MHLLVVGLKMFRILEEVVTLLLLPAIASTLPMVFIYSPIYPRVLTPAPTGPWTPATRDYQYERPLVEYRHSPPQAQEVHYSHPVMSRAAATSFPNETGEDQRSTFSRISVP